METQTHTVDAGALMARVALLIDQGRPNAARPLLSAVRGLSPPSSTLCELAARLALSDGILDGADRDLDAAIAADPEHAGLRKCRAELRRRAGDLENATRDAAEAVIADRTDIQAKALLGVLLYDIGRPAEAAACLREAVAAAPADPAYREALARALAQNGDPDAGLATLQQGIAIVPAAASLRNAAILLCIQHRDFTQAEGIGEQARLAGAADAATFGLRGHALSSLGRHADAALAYADALKLAPDDPYVRHLAAAAGIAASAARAPEDYVRALFDGYAVRFDQHLISLGYRIPGLIRRHADAFARAAPIGPVLDLGCGTGMLAVALSDLPIGPFTGIDLSPAMLAEAEAKGLYADLRQADLPAALSDDVDPTTWRLIVAADLMCYFGALEDMLASVRVRLTPAGRFIFSVEALLPDHDGALPGNGDWSLGRMGRYAHTPGYITAAAASHGFTVIALNHEALRHEAGGPVAGLIVVLERPLTDA